MKTSQRITKLLQISNRPLTVTEMSEILGMPAAKLYPIVWRMVERKEIDSYADYSRAAARGGRPEYRYSIKEENNG